MIQFALTAIIYLAFQCMLVLGLNLQFGLTGILNLAFIIFYATGAYVAGIITAPAAPTSLTYIGGWSLPFWVGIIGAVVAAGAVAAIVGALSLGRRLRGSYTAITTLVVGVVALAYVSQSQGLFDGNLGLLGVPQPFGRGLSSSAFAYLYAGVLVAVVAICAALCLRLARSPFGRTLRAIREDEVAAEVFGYNVFRFKLTAFILGAMLAGLSGCFTIYYVGSFSPGGWGVSETLFTLTCIFVGGAGNTIGVIVGASLIEILFVQLTSLLPTIQSDPSLISVLRGMLIPLLLILMLRFRPTGLLPERLPRLPSYGADGLVPFGSAAHRSTADPGASETPGGGQRG